MNFKLLDFQIFGDERGSLISLEGNKNIPFEIKRVYYIFDTKNDVVRGKHAHKNLQQILIAPKDYSVVATLNLNGDYISDALAAEVGGIGIAPGANINYKTGSAVFEATHGTAPKFAGTNSMNPSSVILSGCMMLEYMGWKEAADLITTALQATIMRKTVTIDFYNLMTGATLLKTTEFGDAIIENMGTVTAEVTLKKSSSL